MTVRRDAIGNLIGHYASDSPTRKFSCSGRTWIPFATRENSTASLGSSRDCLRRASAQNQATASLAIEVIAFCDEEGVRFQSTYLGAKFWPGLSMPEILI